MFVSGSTAMGGFMPLRFVTPAHATPHFATTAWGYAVLEVEARGGWAVRFHDFWGEPLYCCAAAEGGACRPVHCQ